MKKLNKTTRNSRKTSTLGVSRKFYTEICDRINNAVKAVGGNDEDVEMAITVIRSYLIDGIEPDSRNDMKIKLIFSLLKSEIDKAAERSRKARLRAAAKRCEQTKPNGRMTDEDVKKLSSMVIDDITGEKPYMNIKITRRERRRMERECRKMERKEWRDSLRRSADSLSFG